jgi:hypothetical protein
MKVAWADMAALVIHLHNTTAKHANGSVGRVGA